VIPIVIQAVPARAAMVEYLLHHLPDAIVVWDQAERPNVWRTWREALCATEGAAHVHLEDDVTLTRDFAEKVREVTHDGGLPYPVALWDRHEGWSRPMVGGDFWAAVGFYLPRGFGPAIAADVARYPVVRDNYIDHQLGGWLTRRKLGYWLQRPSLVQHTSIPSTLGYRTEASGKRSRHRVSPTFVDPELACHPYPEAVIVAA